MFSGERLPNPPKEQNSQALFDESSTVNGQNSGEALENRGPKVQEANKFAFNLSGKRTENFSSRMQDILMWYS